MAVMNGVPHAPGGKVASESTSNTKASSTSLKRAADDDLHDVVCVGFGPASLAIAVALQDGIEAEDPRLGSSGPKVRFIERQPEYQWHPGMLLDDSKMQISFLKDLATLRNPRSRFTFINYLHDQQRLVQFTNVGVMLPSRNEYNDYMRWCAGAFDSVVDYGRTVTRIEAVESESATAAVQCFRVVSSEHQTGKEFAVRARHVIVAIGGRPSIPKALRTSHPRIIHSSQYVTHAESLFEHGCYPRRVAVIGAGQSAAEIFYDIPSRFPGAQSVLITRGAALRPSDDSPFVNEVFDPSKTDDVFAQDPEVRAQLIAANKVTNYGVVRLDLLEKIYSSQYAYRVKRWPVESWPHLILNHSSVANVRASEAKDGSALQLVVEQNETAPCSQKSSAHQILEVDLIVAATGYERNVHEELMQDLHVMRPDEDAQGWTVGRNYAVRFKEGALEDGRGIWLQGCNEKTHGLPDSLLSILSVRAGEVVDSIFGARKGKLSMR
ncbi:L-ornithine N(5)-monooxygenase [Pseudocercospora fuligena]|uniref:L-ornithine N(5)-monooxygenase [NAD(P)H] n=1 Tax=Pseudocercospora fuligena TaxID=685502 RepID=A0A8H6RQE8_9PEZI|nr:L-ornithine N(5)-monooxygenase [Pseudocercospora fuligena]